MKWFIIVCMLIVPFTAHAYGDEEDYVVKDNFGRVIERGTCDSYGCTTYNQHGQRTGTIESDSTYRSKPKYMPELGKREGSRQTVHLPSLNDMMNE